MCPPHRTVSRPSPLARDDERPRTCVITCAAQPADYRKNWFARELLDAALLASPGSRPSWANAALERAVAGCPRPRPGLGIIKYRKRAQLRVVVVARTPKTPGGRKGARGLPCSLDLVPRGSPRRTAGCPGWVRSSGGARGAVGSRPARAPTPRRRCTRVIYSSTVFGSKRGVL